MRLIELFLKETTDEDRAIVSLSGLIASYISRYKDKADDEDNDIKWDDTDIDFEGDYTSGDNPIQLGKIGQLFNSPIDALNNVTLELQSDYGIRLRRKRDENDIRIQPPDEGVTHGIWYPEIKTIVLNGDFIGTNLFNAIISHELRHALDDLKSNSRAGVSRYYSTPKKKEHRFHVNKHVRYLAQPAEINARYLQVMHDMLPIIRRASRLKTERSKYSIKISLERLMAEYNVASLFPEKEQSKDYRRLLNRAFDFIRQELDKIQSKNSS